MRKNFAILIASLCASLTLSAQDLVQCGADVTSDYPQSNPAVSQSSQQSRPMTKITLEDDEKIMGFYNSDELPDDRTAFGFRAGDHIAGAIFPTEVIGGFVGGQITKVRIALASSVGSSDIAIYDVDENGELGTVQAKGRIERTAYGWNDAIMETPMTIQPNTRYMITYTYTQYASEYPIFADKSVNEGNAYEGGFKVKFEGNATWTDMGVFYGNLCIQAVVKGGSFSDYDVTLSKLTLDKKTYQKGENINFLFSIKSTGDNVPTDYKLIGTLDGEPVDVTFEDLPESLKYSSTVAGTYAIPETLEGAAHTFGISVAEINGQKPSKNTHDDVITADIKTYAETLPRQKVLLEAFTSVHCTFCPIGSGFVKMIDNLRDDLAMITIHASMGSSIDELANDDSQYLARYMCAGYPAAAYNRYYVEDTNINFESKIGLGTGYTTNHDYYANKINTEVIEKSLRELPSFASIDIVSEYNDANRELKVTVSGDATEDLHAFYGDNAKLYVYLKENKIVSPQLDGGTWIDDYVHNNVFRQSLTEVTGDAMNWESELSYKNTYTTTLPADWKPLDMKVIAFIAPELSTGANVREVGVINAEEQKMADPSSISQSVTDKAEVTEVARFTVDGRQISAPVKGINIVKMSDGTCVKEMVK